MPDTDYYRHLGELRASQDSFRDHNRQRAPEGWAGYSAHWRARQGLPLLDTWHIQYLRPGDFVSNSKGQLLTSEQQQLIYFVSLWKAVWGHIPKERRPEPPSQEQYELATAWVRGRLRQGLPLDHPLDVIFMSPDDLYKKCGKPYREAAQKKRFRELFAAGCKAALATLSSPRALGQRVSQSEKTPRFSERHPADPKRVIYGRPDLPSYDQRNIAPQRPYLWPT